MAAICRFVDIYLDRHRYAPSVREVMDFLGLQSSSTAHNVIRQCKEKGWLADQERTARTLHTTKAFRQREKRK